MRYVLLRSVAVPSLVGGSGAVCALCTGLVSRFLAIVEVWWLGCKVVVVLLGFSYWFSVAGACEELLSRSSRLSLESSVAARGGPRDCIASEMSHQWFCLSRAALEQWQRVFWCMRFVWASTIFCEAFIGNPAIYHARTPALTAVFIPSTAARCLLLPLPSVWALP
ncbi:hypothetical protein F2Q69_00051264 [Brassica cretica]|uniref:Uncharacterized protein n=1 Tax=Brassica cretica TaxID=69181 RepID=A0A8S9PHM6_BRACR|nr:hypothetical protein F2Q69_00051264 [Brassica cretica]